VLYKITRERYPDEILPYKEFFLNADPSRFGPELKKAITPIITDELIPAFVGKNKRALDKLAAMDEQSSRPGGSRDAIDELVGLHERAGRDEFSWQIFADLRNAEWDYHAFDPIASERVPFDQIITRYRAVTLPDGMADWYAKDFEPSQAGWKTGKSPFGNYDGKIPTGPMPKCFAHCDGRHGPKGCFSATPVNTLWENEVLLMRGTFDLPAIEPGHRYRMRINSGDHVGTGGGYIVYINGKPLVEKDQGNGRGSGDQPVGGFITTAFFDDFDGGEVTIAVKSFMRYNAKYKAKPTSKTPQNKISLHFESQKLPPMGDDLVKRSAALVPMMSSDWQVRQDPDDPSIDVEEDLFRWDGKHVESPLILGNWTLVAEVPEVAAFDPEKRQNPRRPPFDAIAFKPGGETVATGEPAYLWSGNTLMNLTRYEALQMRLESIAGTEYLFVERGGFNRRHRPGWKTNWFVLTRQP
ncbi:MAG: hypothetical protein ACPGYV_09545, partial [Phycisphaeraceae bacterium]